MTAGARPGASEAWFAPHQDVCGRIIHAFRSARSRVDLCVFTITDDRIARAMVEAHRRGVKIRVVSDDDKSGDRGSDIERLAEAGLSVRVDRTPVHMHHKFAIFDGEMLLTGSYNWTRTANDENSENVLVTFDPALVAAYVAELERVWSAAIPL